MVVGQERARTPKGRLISEIDRDIQGKHTYH
jgi:hypothetical protein